MGKQNNIPTKKQTKQVKYKQVKSQRNSPFLATYQESVESIDSLNGDEI